MKKRRIELIKADKSHRTCYQDRIDLIIVLFDTSDRTSYTHFDKHGTVTMGRYQIPGPRASIGTLDIKYLFRWDTI